MATAPTQSGNPPASMRIPELPNEILLLIVGSCPGSTLKTLRRCNRNLNQLIEPVLWRKVVLIPNDHSVLGLTRALKRTKNLRHVKELTYDGRFGNFLQDIKNVAPDAALSEIPESRPEELAKLSRIQLGALDDASVEVACLGKALRQLPNVKRVCIREPGEIGTIAVADVPFFYLKICSNLGVNPDSVSWSTMHRRTSSRGAVQRSYTKGFLMAAYMTECKFHSIKAKNIDATNMFGHLSTKPLTDGSFTQRLGMYKNVIDSVRQLELSFRNEILTSSPHVPNAVNYIDAIQHMLKAGKRVRKLRLKLSDLSKCRGYYADEDLVSDFTGILESVNGTWSPKSFMPHLHTLVIDACVCRVEDLMHFLKIHSRTLRQLELSNVTLLSGDSGRECWVRLIKHLKSALRLTSVSFSGWLSNGGRQQWSVAKETIDNQRLKARVERYVVERQVRQCPLDAVAIKPYQQDVEKPADGTEIEGDLTWTMVYSHGGGPLPPIEDSLSDPASPPALPPEANDWSVSDTPDSWATPNAPQDWIAPHVDVVWGTMEPPQPPSDTLWIADMEAAANHASSLMTASVPPNEPEQVVASNTAMEAIINSTSADHGDTPLPFGYLSSSQQSHPAMGGSHGLMPPVEVFND
jgi:hypothetical protein